jgi:uncharacterized protein (TIGR00725 family)
VAAATPSPGSSPVISIFGSSKAAEGEVSHQVALELGAALANAGFAVATGGYSGLMAAVSRGASEAGGHVIGVVARTLPGKSNRWVDEEVIVDTWEQRLFRLIALGDGYVACSGATGTLVELAVAWEMMCKGLIARKPLVALGAFWQPVIDRIETADQATCGYVSLTESAPAAVAFLHDRLLGRSIRV